MVNNSQRETTAARLNAAKKSFVCRRVDFTLAHGLTRTCLPRSGDLVLARVDELGHHGKLETFHGRRAQLYPGDEIVLAYGARYAPDQFEAVVPSAVGPCDMVAGGGIAARVVARHASARKPTAVTPVGVLVDHAGQALNLRQFALPRPPANAYARSVIGVVGTSMNAGKTTAAASLIRGLSSGGVRVGACKVTGTGSGGDLWSMLDAGAVRALDFTDAGYATTAGADIAALEQAARGLITHLEADDVDIVVVEIADGLLQRETSALLNPTSLASRFDGVVLAAADAMGAVAGANLLISRNLPLRAITGLLTASPLATAEVKTAIGVDVVSTKALTRSDVASRICLRAPGWTPRSIVS